VIQDLAGVVENRSVGVTYDLRQYRFFAGLRITEFLPLCPDDQLVQVVDIPLQVLFVMELQRPGAYHRLKCIGTIR
jgi:hypothetical protein